MKEWMEGAGAGKVTRTAPGEWEERRTQGAGPPIDSRHKGGGKCRGKRGAPFSHIHPPEPPQHFYRAH